MITTTRLSFTFRTKFGLPSSMLPSGVEWHSRAVLAERGLVGDPKTSGSRGMQINVRIVPRWSSTEVGGLGTCIVPDMREREATSAKGPPGQAAIDAWSNITRQLETAARNGEAEPSESLRRELQRAGRLLGVPVDTPRDDAHVFLADPARLSTATWTQCGGVLHALLRHDASANLEAWIGAVERLTVLAPTHR